MMRQPVVSMWRPSSAAEEFTEAEKKLIELGVPEANVKAVAEILSRGISNMAIVVGALSLGLGFLLFRCRR